MITASLLPLSFAAEVHTFRSAPRDWSSIVGAVKTLGFDAISLLAPWSFHQPGENTFDWEGSLDLARAVDLASEHELAVILHPGPRLCRELTGSGFPEWLLADQSLHAKTIHGHRAIWPYPPLMHPIPDYCDPRFRDRVGDYFAALKEHLGARAEHITAVVTDHELCRFHHDSLPWDTAEVSRWLEDALTSAGFAAPIVPSVPAMPIFARPALGPSAVHVCTTARNAYRSIDALTSAQPALALITAGGSPFLPPRSADDDRLELFAALAADVGAISIATVAERDRHYGAWIRSTGSITEHGKRMAAVIQAVQRIRRQPLICDSAITVVVDRSGEEREHRHSTITDLPAAIPAAINITPASYSAQPEAEAKTELVLRALRWQQLPHTVADHSWRAAGDERAIVVIASDRIDASLWSALQQCEAPVVFLGPTPMCDAYGEPLADLTLPRRAAVVQTDTDEKTLADDLAALAGELPADGFAAPHPDIRCHSWRDDTGALVACIVCNLSGERVSTTVTLPVAGKFFDPFFDRDVASKSPLDLDPFEISLLVRKI